MSTPIIAALTQKREALIQQIRELQSQVFHIDGTIEALGGKRRKRQKRMFGPGELIKLIGEAERKGLETAREVALHIIRVKELDPDDKSLYRPIRWGVTDCRRRMEARGV